MATQPQPLDWTRLNHIGTRITWEAQTYQHFKDQVKTSPAYSASGLDWVCLPFESAHMDKLPVAGGIYAFSYTYGCLGFPEQKIIMYVGETENLRSRLNEYMGIYIGISEGIPEDDPAARPNRRNDRLRHLFSTFEKLEMLYCTLNLTEDERCDLERNLINLLDPPFNWAHRPKPKRAPTIGRPGTILTNPTVATSAFKQQTARRTR